MTYPVTTEASDHPGGYEGALSEFYDRWAATLAGHLDAGRDVGDPVRGRPALLRLVHLPARAPRAALPHRGRPGRDVVQRRGRLGRHSARAPRRGALHPPRHAARRGARVAPEHERRGGRDQARPQLRRRCATPRGAPASASTRSTWSARARRTSSMAALGEVDEESVPYMSLVLVPGAQDDAAPRGGRARRRRARARRPGVADTRGAHRAGPGRRAGRLRRPTSRACPRGAARSGARATTGSSWSGRARRSSWRSAAPSVAVVSSGDPGIFAMAAAVYEAVEEAGERFAAVPVRIVPGVSAMQVAAARAGAPLGHDFCVISLSDQLKPWAVIERRLAAAASADMAIALYNPASQTRREQLARARDVLLEHRAGETPVVLARAIGSDEESLAITTLAGFDLEAVDMRTVVLIGSSQTRLVRDAAGAPRVYTPRSYPDGAPPQHVGVHDPALALARLGAHALDLVRHVGDARPRPGSRPACRRRRPSRCRPAGRRSAGTRSRRRASRRCRRRRRAGPRRAAGRS